MGPCRSVGCGFESKYLISCVSSEWLEIAVNACPNYCLALSVGVALFNSPGQSACESERDQINRLTERLRERKRETEAAREGSL